ncbi:hypothetical protein BC830DRAFT_1086420 [Chytriomyces sp. MP71]|nr:hypothetical protein BC830DRAFT_1086420 [Chytriomyces sp. MP71]
MPLGISVTRVRVNGTTVKLMGVKTWGKLEGGGILDNFIKKNLNQVQSVVKTIKYSHGYQLQLRGLQQDSIAKRKHEVDQSHQLETLGTTVLLDSLREYDLSLKMFLKPMKVTNELLKNVAVKYEDENVLEVVALHFGGTGAQKKDERLSATAGADVATQNQMPAGIDESKWTRYSHLL